MRPAVFVLGISHPLQCGAAECGADRISLLEQKIRRALSKHGIRRIAEEMSDDGFRERAGDEAARETVCQRIAPTMFPSTSSTLARRKGAAYRSRMATLSGSFSNTLRQPQTGGTPGIVQCPLRGSTGACLGGACFFRW